MRTQGVRLDPFGYRRGCMKIGFALEGCKRFYFVRVSGENGFVWYFRRVRHGELLCCMAGVTRGRDLRVGIAASGDLPSLRNSTERGSSPK